MVSWCRPAVCDGLLLLLLSVFVLRRDTAGQERYQTITKQYYRRAQVTPPPPTPPAHGRSVCLTRLRLQGIIFVYDVTNAASFQRLAKWVGDVEEVSAL